MAMSRDVQINTITPSARIALAQSRIPVTDIPAREHLGLSHPNLDPMALHTVGRIADHLLANITAHGSFDLREIIEKTKKDLRDQRYAGYLEDMANAPGTWTSFSQARGHIGYQALVWAFRAIDKTDHHCHISAGLHELEMANMMLSAGKNVQQNMIDELKAARKQFRRTYPAKSGFVSSDFRDFGKALRMEDLGILANILRAFLPLNLWSAKDFCVTDLPAITESVRIASLRSLLDGVTSFDLRMNPVKPKLVGINKKDAIDRVVEIARQVIDAAIAGFDAAADDAKKYGVPVNKNGMRLLFSLNRSARYGESSIAQVAEQLFKNIDVLEDLFPGKIAGIDVSGSEYGTSKYTPEQWKSIFSAARHHKLIATTHIGDMSSIDGDLLMRYKKLSAGDPSDSFEQLALDHLDFVERFLRMDPTGIGHAFALEPSFISDVWPVLNGDGFPMPDLEQFPSVADKAAELRAYAKSKKMIFEHCPSVTASSEIPSADTNEDNLVSSYAKLRVYEWIKQEQRVGLGTDGIWFTGNRPRTLSEELVRILLARPNELTMEQALKLVGQP